MKPFSTLLALAVILAAATAAGACETVVYQTTGQSETRTWVSGHYEWVGDTWAYVSGHWVVTPARCETTEIQRTGETVVYVERPTTRVVYVDPPCQRTVVVAPACPPPVVIEERRCAPPRRECRSRVDIAVVPVPIPLPLPDPFCLFRHHHH